MYAGRLLAARRSQAIRQPRDIPRREVPPPSETLRISVSSNPRNLRKAELKSHIRSSRRAWGTVQRFLCQRKLIAVINVIVLATLSWKTLILILSNFPSREPQIPVSMRSYLAAFSAPSPPQMPGCGRVRHATFRDKYPSTTLAHLGTFDAVFVISNPRCSHWEEFKSRADAAELTITNWPMLDWRRITLDAPPVPLSQRLKEGLNPAKRTAVKTLKRQLVYMDAHRRVWQTVIDKAIQRALVIDESFFPSKRLLESFPPMMTNIDTESIAKRQAWHIVQFRLIRAWAHKRETWSMNPVYHHALVRANASLGAGMYALSSHGAKFLTQRVKEYRAPLDVEFGLLQVQDYGFIALSGCNNDRVKPFCPEMVDVLQTGESMECLWRRFWETRNVGIFKKMLRS